MKPIRSGAAPWAAAGSQPARAAWDAAAARGAAPLCFALFLSIALAQTNDLVAVVSKPVSRTVDLPAELQPYLTVALHAKVAGYVERVLVDRGSVVKQGDLLAELSAPEMTAQIAEGAFKVQACEADRVQAEAQLGAA